MILTEEITKEVAYAAPFRWPGTAFAIRTTGTAPMELWETLRMAHAKVLAVYQVTVDTWAVRLRDVPDVVYVNERGELKRSVPWRGRVSIGPLNPCWPVERMRP